MDRPVINDFLHKEWSWLLAAGELGLCIGHKVKTLVTSRKVVQCLSNKYKRLLDQGARINGVALGLGCYEGKCGCSL